ncbi:MAG: hypothetical protein A4E53_00338 [Pelotomaculum sp. PtaB.Bin104]|nr:MAG: hypothetical protein A4E53_00338 [Pelotomaculum sp. PtaB.Bin104]
MFQLHLIPPEYQEFWNLFKYLNPSDSVVWWEAGICNISNKKYKPVFCSDTSVKITLTEFSKENTYYSNYYSIFPYQYYLVFKTQSGDIRYINKVEQLISFIGVVDNLPEALFLAHMYGYANKHGRKFGSFCYNNGVVTFNLYKILHPPDVLEDNKKLVKSKIKVDAKGNVYEFTSKINPKWRKLTVKDMYGH